MKSQHFHVMPCIGFNKLRPRQHGRHFADDIFKGIFLNENVWIPIKFSLKFVPKGRINNIPALVHIMAWRRPGDKPLSKPMLVFVPTHICVTRPQWVKPCTAFVYLRVKIFYTCRHVVTCTLGFPISRYGCLNSIEGSQLWLYIIYNKSVIFCCWKMYHSALISL